MGYWKRLFFKIKGQENGVIGLPKQKTPPDGGIDTDGFNVTICSLPGLKDQLFLLLCWLLATRFFFGCDHEVRAASRSYEFWVLSFQF